jgi:hypothetical protein
VSACCIPSQAKGKMSEALYLSISLFIFGFLVGTIAWAVFAFFLWLERGR